MQKAAIWTIIVLWLTALPAVAETIYIWTDKDGVKRFSNRPPEGGVTYETEEGAVSESQTGDRSEFDRMIEEVKRENREAEIQREQEAARRKAEAERRAREEKEARIEAERARLQEEIDELNRRALSPTFTQGMRENLIQKIREKMEALE